VKNKITKDRTRCAQKRQSQLHYFSIKRLGKKGIELMRRRCENIIKTALMEIACMDVHLM